MPITGTAYGCILNVRQQVEQLASAFEKAPYNTPPRAPVLYIKPVTTFCPHGGEVPVPASADELEVAATIGVVIGHTACRVPESEALDHVLGYTLAIDVCIPHTSFFRPAVRQRCRDSFLPIGPWVVDKAAIADPNMVTAVLLINGEEKNRLSTADLVRPIARLIADVTDFSTLFAGDVLLIGLAPNAPHARIGDKVSAQADGIGCLDCEFVAEQAATENGA